MKLARISCGLSLLVLLQPTVSKGETLFQDGFETALEDIWTPWYTQDGRATVTTNFAPASGSRHVVLDDAVNDAVYSSAGIATQPLNFSGKQNILLEFKVKSLGNEPDDFWFDPVQGVPMSDGVFISKNGGYSWDWVDSLAYAGTEWATHVVNLDYHIFVGGFSGESVMIGFFAYDNASVPIDGIAIDDVIVTATPSNQDRIVVEIPSSIWEDSGTPYTGYVMLSAPKTNDIAIELFASPDNQLSLPASATIPAGATFASFLLSPINDTNVNLARGVSITASYAAEIGVQTLTILDDETPNATLVIPSSLTEGDDATNGWIFLNRAPETSMSLKLMAPQGQIQVPYEVVVGAGQTSAVFAISAADDSYIEGPAATTLKATYPGMPDAQAETVVLDNDPAVMWLAAPGAILEGAIATAGINFSGYLPTNVTVTLASTNTGQISFTPTIVTSGGSWDFSIIATDNLSRDGSRVVWLTATAPGFTSSTVSITILDNEVAGYLVEGIGDIAIRRQPLGLSVAAVATGGNILSNYTGMVFLEVLSSNGVAQPVYPSPISMFPGGWAGTVQLPAGLAAPARIRAYDNAGNKGTSEMFDVMESVSGTFADVTWDSLRQRFYATIGSNAEGTNANQVVSIDPASGQIVNRLPLAQDPGQLVLTSGGENLYVVVNANGTIAKINPATFSVESTFPVGANPTLYAADICPVRGQPNLLVVSRRTGPPWNTYASIAVFDAGVPLQVIVSSPLGGLQIEPSADPGMFFAHYSDGLKKLVLTNDGITEVEANHQILASLSFDIEADQNLVLAQAWSGTEIVDGSSLTHRGSLNTGEEAVPDAALGGVYAFGRPEPWLPIDHIAAWDPISSVRLVELRFASEIGSPRRLRRWGASGLTFLTETNLNWFTSARLVPSAPPADLAIQVQASPLPAFAGIPLTYVISVTNFGPNAAQDCFVKSVLSSEHTIQSISASMGTIKNTGLEFRLDAGLVPSGDGFSVVIHATPLSGGELFCKALVSSQSIDPATSNNVHAAELLAGAITPANALSRLRYGAENLCWDGTRERLWVTLSGSVHPSGEPVLMALNPSNGLVTASIPLGREPAPHCMAISGNGRFLYIGLQDAPEIARMDLDASPVSVVYVPLGPDFGPAVDVEVLTEDGLTFIAASSFKSEAFVFDGTTRRPNGGPATRIEIAGLPNGFVGSVSWQGKLSRYDITPQGVTLAKEVLATLGGNNDFEGEDGLLLSSGGRLFDAMTLGLLADFEATGPSCLDPQNSSAYILATDRLSKFNTSTWFPEGDFILPYPFAGQQFSSCIRWGADGFAFDCSGGDLYIGRWSGIAEGADTDGDGMPDGWEILYLGSVQEQPGGDKDLDGTSNGLEYVYATDPGVPNSNPLQFSLVNVAGQNKFRLEFPRRAGLAPLPYSYQVSTNLSVWTTPVGLTETVLDTEVIDGVTVETIEVMLPAPNIAAAFLRFLWGGL